MIAWIARIAKAGTRLDCPTYSTCYPTSYPTYFFSMIGESRLCGEKDVQERLRRDDCHCLPIVDVDLVVGVVAVVVTTVMPLLPLQPLQPLLMCGPKLMLTLYAHS